MQTEAETAKKFCQKVVDCENEYQVSVWFVPINHSCAFSYFPSDWLIKFLSSSSSSSKRWD